MIKKAATTAVLATLVLSICPTTASAWDGPWYSNYGLGSWLYPARNIYVTESVPYFALNPPVYYSYPVPRTYGYSPFAYPPGTMTPDSRQREPLAARNQYVVGEIGVTAGQASQQQRPPLRIRNPYVDESNPAAPAGAQAPKDL